MSRSWLTPEGFEELFRRSLLVQWLVKETPADQRAALPDAFLAAHSHQGDLVRTAALDLEALIDAIDAEEAAEERAARRRREVR